jgi:S1-C subfamily serine protease
MAIAHARARSLSAGLWRFDREFQPSPAEEEDGFEPPGKGLLRLVWNVLRRRSVQVVGVAVLALSIFRNGLERKGPGKAGGILHGNGVPNAPERYVRSKDPAVTKNQQEREREKKRLEKAPKQETERAEQPGLRHGKESSTPFPLTGKPAPLDSEAPVPAPEGIQEEGSGAVGAPSSEKDAEEEPLGPGPDTERGFGKEQGLARKEARGGPLGLFRGWGRSKTGGEQAGGGRREGEGETGHGKRETGEGSLGKEEEGKAQSGEGGAEKGTGGEIDGKGGEEVVESGDRRVEGREVREEEGEERGEEEEEEEEEEGEGTVPFEERETPLLEDGEAFLARRGDVLQGAPAGTEGREVRARGRGRPRREAPGPAVVPVPGAPPSSSSSTFPPPPASSARPSGSSSFVGGVFRAVAPAVPRVDCVKVYKGEIKFASGSGVIYSPEGYLMTNSLLVRNALELKVTLADGREYPAEIKGVDEVLDVAVLKIIPPTPLAPVSSPPSLPAFQYAPVGDSESLQVGDWVLSVGSPRSPGPSVILGIVSGLTKTAAEVGRPETQVSFIQTDASFDAGVVGGPLVNEYGEVVGINSIGLRTSSTVQFSVPINQLKAAVEALARGREVHHPSIGVEMMPITPTLAAQLNQQAMLRQGQLQVQEEERMAEEKRQRQEARKERGQRRSGGRRQVGDGKDRDTGGALAHFLRKAQHAGGFLRQWQQPSDRSTPPPPPSSSPSSVGPSSSSSPPSQIQFIPEGGAVVVVHVLEDSPAQHGGLRHLDILLEIDRCPIYGVGDAQRIIHSSGVGRDLEIKVLRNTQEVTLHVRTTDFLTLFKKQQAAKKYPELRPKVKEGRRVGEEGGWLDGENAWHEQVRGVPGEQEGEQQPASDERGEEGCAVGECEEVNEKGARVGRKASPRAAARGEDKMGDGRSAKETKREDLQGECWT